MRPPLVRTAPCRRGIVQSCRLLIRSAPCVCGSCDHCIKREFQHHREIPCPACQKLVKKSQLQDKTIEELNFAKETSVRKKVSKECVRR